jgi:tetratricopeptide (TPR) repeat protein
MKNMMNKKLMILAAAVIILPAVSLAQTTREEFVARYNTLSSRLGPAGVGIETLINRWEAAFPDDPDMTAAKYSYYFYKSSTVKIIPLAKERYLGREPVLPPYVDSLGVKRAWFEDTEYDDSLFAIANSAIDRAINYHPERLDLRFVKLNGLLNYEKESPDMTLALLRQLVDENYKSSPKWEYPGMEVTPEVFKTFMQDYCYAFYRIGSDASAEAFKSFSETMLEHYPSDPLFLDNIGSYYLVFKGDTKTALKYYNKVLKKNPDDLTAIRNCILAARRDKNVKLEKKYLPMLVKYGETETDRKSAETRLQALSAGK